MATIKKREGKTGTSYLIRSSCGYDTSGRPGDALHDVETEARHDGEAD